MKIIRYFLQHESDDTGINGWIPMWVGKSKGFDPMQASGMAHDALEHRLCDSGTYEEELMAFGRLIALRGLSGLGFRSFRSPEYNLGMELAGIWDRSNEENLRDLLPAPTTTKLDRYIETFLSGVCDAFVRYVGGNNSGDDEEVELSPVHLGHMRSWLRIGVRDAVRRYGEIDHGCYDVGQALVHWGELNRRRLDLLAEDEPGSALRLVFDTKSCRFTDTLIRPSWETGELPYRWLRDKLFVWRTT
jgi:hypothetical protein